MNKTSHLQAGTRAVARCDELGVVPYSVHSGHLFRPFLSKAHVAARLAVAEWMQASGLTPRIDPVGNLVGRSEAAAGLPCLMIGSHLDTVEDAGRYDGALGIMIGIECAAILAGYSLPFALEVIAFGDEEGSRFPTSMMCSRAITCPLEPSLLETMDRDGITLREALSGSGLDPLAVACAVRQPGDVIGYIEPHIEQGPVLERLGLPVGIVTGIAGQVRLLSRFEGVAGHAGTTPMHYRQDALAAAAEAVLAVEAICGQGTRDLVGTVGRLSTSSSAFNVIAGAVEIGIDIRAASDHDRDVAAAEVRQALEAISVRRGVTVKFETVQALAASPCDADLVALLEASVEAAGIPAHRLVSGAGHDAMTVAAIAPTVMLFIRSAGGISHNPQERTSPEDAGVAIRSLVNFVLRLAGTHS